METAQNRAFMVIYDFQSVHIFSEHSQKMPTRKNVILKLQWVCKYKTVKKYLKGTLKPWHTSFLSDIFTENS